MDGVIKGVSRGPCPPSFGKKVFKRHTIKICFSCSECCPGTSMPSAAHLTLSLPLCSSGNNAQGEFRVLEGHRVSSKSHQKVQN